MSKSVSRMNVDNRQQIMPLAIIGICIISLNLSIYVLDDVTIALYGMIGIILSVTSLVLMIMNPMVGLFAIILINPIDSLIYVPGLSSVGRLIGIIVTIGWFLKYVYGQKTIFFNLIKSNSIPLMLIMSMILSSSLAQYPLQSLQDVFTILLLILMVFFMWDFINDNKKLNVLILFIALSVGVASLVGIAQYVGLQSGNTLIGNVTYEGEARIERVRMAGFQLNPNGYGVLLMTGIPSLLFLSTNGRNFVLKIVSAILFFTSVVSLTLTMSRTSIMGFTVFLIIYIFLNFKCKIMDRKQMTILIIIVTFLLLIFSVFLSDFLKQRSYSFEHLKGEARYSILLKGVDLLMEHPLLGVGFRNFELVDTSDKKYEFIYGRTGHDVISVIFASTGLVGGLLFIGLCYKTLMYFNAAIYNFTKQNERYLLNFSLILKSAFLALLFTGLSNPLIFQRIFWIYVGLAIIIHRWSISQLDRQKEI